MVILFCSNTYESTKNGPSKFARVLLDLNLRSDIELHVLTEDISIPTNFVHKIDIRKSFLFSRIGMLTRIQDYYLGVEKFIEHIVRPDIIIFNNAIVGVKTFMRYNIPSIGMINDSLSINNTFRKGEIKKFIRHLVFSFYERRACFHSNLTLVNSNSLLEKLLKTYNVERTKVKVLYKGINTDINDFANPFSNTDRIKVLFVKAAYRRGGLITLIKALKTLDRKCTLNIIGPNQHELSAIIRDNKSSKLNIIALGNCEQQEVFSHMTKADIFCTPSYTEALGIANMEAMLHKLPVVYSKVGGVPEVMNYGKNGYESLPKNVLSLSNALVECINKPKLREKKVEAGYKFVLDNFNKNKMLDNFIEISKSIADG